MKCNLCYKIIRAFKKFLNQKQFIFRLRPINTCKKTELKPRWTVPLSRAFLEFSLIETANR
jgi:hypothetical protein